MKIEKMMQLTLKEPEKFNHYPYYEKALCNQFVFAIEGEFELALDRVLICRIVPKMLWEKKKIFFTEEINLSDFLGPNSEDLNGTGCWILPDFSRNPLECAKELVELGFVWSQSLQEAVIEDPSSDAVNILGSDFVVTPNAEIATEINKIMTPEIELEIFEGRLGVKRLGLEKALLNFYSVIRTSPITKEKVLLAFLKKHNIPYNAKIDKDSTVDFMTTICWLNKSQIVKYYIKDIPKNTIDKYGRTLLNISVQYKCSKTEEILRENDFNI